MVAPDIFLSLTLGAPMAEWCKWHTEAIADPKLVTAFQGGAKGIGYLPWLLAHAKHADDSGRLTTGGKPLTVGAMHHGTPWCTVKEIRACLATCVSLGILEEQRGGVLCFAKWDKRQMKPSASTDGERERKAAYRAKLAGEDSTGAPEEKPEPHPESQPGPVIAPPPSVAPVVTPPVQPSLAVRLVVAANTGVQDAIGEQPKGCKVDTGATEMAGWIVKNGVDETWALATIRERAGSAAKRKGRSPGSVAYFTLSLREAWADETNARAVASGVDVPAAARRKPSWTEQQAALAMRWRLGTARAAKDDFADGHLDAVAALALGFDAESGALFDPNTKQPFPEVS
jgi:hypothetical protein